LNVAFAAVTVIAANCTSSDAVYSPLFGKRTGSVTDGNVPPQSAAEAISPLSDGKSNASTDINIPDNTAHKSILTTSNLLNP
jgi:hypothetical protein